MRNSCNRQFSKLVRESILISILNTDTAELSLKNNCPIPFLNQQKSGKIFQGHFLESALFMLLKQL